MRLPRPAPHERKWWLVGGVGVALGIVLVTWLALANTLGRVTFTLLGYSDVSDTSVTVTFDVHRPAGVAARCEVRAMDQGFATVGSTTVEVPAGPERSVHQVVTLRTTSRPVTGVVDRCEPVG